MFEFVRVSGYSCPDKWLLTHEGKPIVFANSKARLSKCMAYIEGYGDAIEDGKIKRKLDVFRYSKNIGGCEMEHLIMCWNSKCKHYFEDGCLCKFTPVSIDSDGLCTSFEEGKHEFYSILDSTEKEELK